MGVPTSLTIAAHRFGLYRPARDALDWFIRRERLARRANARRFLSQFVSRGSLVFDVGAHKGEWTERFVELGAAVVAVEPIPHLARAIARHHQRNVIVENAALGAEPGHGRLLVGRFTGHSSLAPRWVELIHASGRELWSAEIAVDVLTLDDLIERHGPPDFVKIDVEGFEPDVLRGLSQPLPCLSFEAHTFAPELARDAVDRLNELGRYEFNLVRGMDFEFALSTWRDGRRMLRELAAIDPDLTDVADIYARLAT